MGTTVNLSDGWQITVLSVIPDATNIVLKENTFNKQPKEGDQFFLAKVQAKYTGPNSTTFGGSYRLRAVGPSSIGYSTFANNPGVIPDPIPDSEVFTGGIIEGNVGWEIKSSDANALVMYDNPISFGGNNDRVFMALYLSPVGTSPQCAVAWSNKGAALDDQGKHDEAIKAYDEAIRLDPNDANAWYNKGVSLLKQGKFNESLQVLNKTIELEPDLAMAWCAKGFVLGKLGEYNESIQAFDKAIELKPGFVEAREGKELALKLYAGTLNNECVSLMNEAGAFFNQGKYDEAVKTFDMALEINQSFKEAWVYKAQSLVNLGKYNEAIKSFDKAIEINQSYKEAWIGKGLALYALGNYTEAINAYDEAIRLDPKDAIVWNNKGNALKALGRNTEADAAYAKAKELGMPVSTN